MSQTDDRAPVTHHSPAAALEAIRSLSDKDKSVLLKIAKVYARTRRTRYEYEDLLHEAIARVLEGGRKWPTTVPFMAFMCGVMRGIAWDWRSEAEDAGSDEATGPAEGDAIARLDAQKLVALFEDDPIAQKLIVGMMEGARGEELWESSGLTKTDYESKRKKIRRRIERLWVKQDLQDHDGRATQARRQ
jgi:RNA polymerase sigma-70 factor (ECF subfamily)